MKYINLNGIYGKGTSTKVSDEDYTELIKYKWTLSSPKNQRRQFVRTRIGKNSCVAMSRFIMGFPKDLYVDHKDGDTLNNTRENLRICTPLQNTVNSVRHYNKKAVDGVVPPKGVRFLKRQPNHPWNARILVNGKRITTKSRKTMQEAYEDYVYLSKKYFGEFFRPSH